MSTNRRRRSRRSRGSRKTILFIAGALVCGVLMGAGLAVMAEQAMLPPAPVHPGAPGASSPSAVQPSTPGGSSLPGPTASGSADDADSGWVYNYGKDIVVSGDMELPVVGATGYTLIDTALWPQASEGEDMDRTLPPGSSFAILEEVGAWWRVEGRGFSGWVRSARCMINLPDVIPSMIFDNTNAYYSAFISSGKDIPGITGQVLYLSRLYNARLNRDEFVMPVLYPTAKRICAAQQAALAEGNTLVLVEAYRPLATQRAVVEGLTALANADAQVKAAINTPPWSMGWFIATGISNHQQGYAVDVTLAKVDATEQVQCGQYTYTAVTAHTRYEMQTPIHELSPAAAAMKTALDPRGNWQNMAPADTMTDDAFTLQRYFTGAGMTPLASEWWHFNDYSAFTSEISQNAKGGFVPDACYSFAP